MGIRQAETFMSWKNVIANCNDMVFGRRSELKDLGYNYKFLKLRRGTFIRKYHYFSGIPQEFVTNVSDHPIYDEGITVIKPYQPGSIGYRIFYTEPLHQAIGLSKQMRALEFELSQVIRNRVWLFSTPEGIERIFKRFNDRVQRTRSAVNIISSPQGQAMTPPPIMFGPKAKPKVKPPMPTGGIA